MVSAGRRRRRRGLGGGDALCGGRLCCGRPSGYGVGVVGEHASEGDDASLARARCKKQTKAKRETTNRDIRAGKIIELQEGEPYKKRRRRRENRHADPTQICGEGRIRKTNTARRARAARALSEKEHTLNAPLRRHPLLGGLAAKADVHALARAAAQGVGAHHAAHRAHEQLDVIDGVAGHDRLVQVRVCDFIFEWVYLFCFGCLFVVVVVGIA